MRTAELDYDLPEELIAQTPAARRDASRLLVLDRAARNIREDTFRNLPDYLRAGDCLVLNDTRVVKARLRAAKPTGGQVEILLLRELGEGAWAALVRPSARVRPGTVVRTMGGLELTIGEVLSGGQRRVTFSAGDVLKALETSGEVPLPPYIRRERPDTADAARYQTIYAGPPGAVAAPTAGLHFTDEVFAALEAKGVRRATLTLHVGYGTFKPIQAERIEEHTMDPEDFDFPEEAARVLNETRKAGGRLVAVGTTTTRVLETQFRDGNYQAGQGVTDKYIYPPYAFRAVDALLTNFHLPRSSLLALVCAFGGTEFVLDAYRYAVERRFRFYSYGDAMLIGAWWDA
jgi:S-adenosylmethionine:tRNA ribosyltransferase-isomerase